MGQVIEFTISGLAPQLGYIGGISANYFGDWRIKYDVVHFKSGRIFSFYQNELALPEKDSRGFYDPESEEFFKTKGI